MVPVLFVLEGRLWAAGATESPSPGAQNFVRNRTLAPRLPTSGAHQRSQNTKRGLQRPRWGPTPAGGRWTDGRTLGREEPSVRKG